MTSTIRFRPVSHVLCAAILSAAFAIGSTGVAQTHRVNKADSVTRAVSVYEYVGDLAHPKAARLIPVSLFLGGHFEDAGVYLARPIPLALDTGNVYEFQHSGVRAGYLDLSFARNYNANAGGAAVANSYDDGWFGYGRFRALPATKAAKALTARNNNAHVVTDSTDGKPKLVSKSDDPAQPLPRGADDDPDRPAKISLPDDTGKKSDSPDPDRPTLHRQSGPPPAASDDKAALDKNGKPAKPPKVVVTATGDPASDPDRPSIRRHTAEENAIPPDPIDLAGGKSPNGPADTVTGGPDANAPNRPSMRRGRQTGPVGETLSRLTLATPENDLSQMAAVSDAKDRPEHDFTFHFGSDADRQAVLRQMESLAQEVLAHPVLATDAPDILKREAAAGKPVPALSASTRAAAPGTQPMRRAGTGRTKTQSRPVVPVNLAGNGLADEQMSAFQLSFSAEPTYVFTAHTPSNAGAVRYATVVAQPDLDGKLQVALRTTTDIDHLDRVPRFRFVDAVDADGSNRASLLFELRASHSRQFALYRLLGPHPDQVFITGSTL